MKISTSMFYVALAQAVLIPLGAMPAVAAPANKPLTSMQSDIEIMGTGVAVGLPLIAAGVTYYKHDRAGLVQLAVETVLTVGTTYALKNIVREQRPDKSDWQSFPSGTTALAASGSSFLWRRYGWQYGLPAFALSQFVSYSRVQANEHHWYDTLASSAIAIGYSYGITTPLKRRYNVNTGFSATPNGAYFQMSYNF